MVLLCVHVRSFRHHQARQGNGTNIHSSFLMEKKLLRRDSNPRYTAYELDANINSSLLMKKSCSGGIQIYNTLLPLRYIDALLTEPRETAQLAGLNQDNIWAKGSVSN